MTHASRPQLATRSGTGAQRKGLAEAGAPGFTWPQGTEARWSCERGGVGWLSPLPLSAKQLVPTAMRGAAQVHPSSALEEELEGVWSMPTARRGLPARCPPAAPGSPVPCLDWCSRTPALGELGPSVTQASEGERKGAKPPCPLGHPGLAVTGAALQGGGVPKDRGAAGPNCTSVGWGPRTRADSSPRCSAGRQGTDTRQDPCPAPGGGGRVPPLPLRCCGTKLFITLNYLFIVLERQLLFMTLGPRGPGVI